MIRRSTAVRTCWSWDLIATHLHLAYPGPGTSGRVRGAEWSFEAISPWFHDDGFGVDVGVGVGLHTVVRLGAYRRYRFDGEAGPMLSPSSGSKSRPMAPRLRRQTPGPEGVLLSPPWISMRMWGRAGWLRRLRGYPLSHRRCGARPSRGPRRRPPSLDVGFLERSELYRRSPAPAAQS